MNDLTIVQPAIEFYPAPVKFNNYDKLKEQALEIAAYLQTIKVDPDTIQTAKKMVAQTRKAVDSLDQDRLQIKKKILRDYDQFEAQVKEIKGIVNDADRFVRNQVKMLEEKEREEKQSKLHTIFDMRFNQYDLPFDKATAFDQWLTPGHLNKSNSINKCEKQMTEWLNKLQSDVDLILTMPEAKELLPVYQEFHYDLTQAMTTLKSRKKLEEKLNESVQEVETDDPVWRTVSIYCTKEELKKAEKLLKAAGFETL